MFDEKLAYLIGLRTYIYLQRSFQAFFRSMFLFVAWLWDLANALCIVQRRFQAYFRHGYDLFLFVGLWDDKDRETGQFIAVPPMEWSRRMTDHLTIVKVKLYHTCWVYIKIPMVDMSYCMHRSLIKKLFVLKWNGLIGHLETIYHKSTMLKVAHMN